VGLEGAAVMTLGELLHRRVVSEDGRSLGRVWDVRVHLRGGRAEVVALAVGRIGIRKRLAGNVERNEIPDDYVQWENVLRLEPGRVVVRASPRPDDSTTPP
jgi:sporulation protein YlmC with PRC-barrel domain